MSPSRLTEGHPQETSVRLGWVSSQFPATKRRPFQSTELDRVIGGSTNFGHRARCIQHTLTPEA